MSPNRRRVRFGQSLEKIEAGVPVVLTGRIEALDEAVLGFRISERMIERPVNAGDQVEAGQLLGRLESLNELNALTAAKANVAAAQAKLTQVRNHFERQETLLAQGWTTRANFDQAERELRTAEAQLDASEAQLKGAHDADSSAKRDISAFGLKFGPRCLSPTDLGPISLFLTKYTSKLCPIAASAATRAGTRQSAPEFFDPGTR